MTYNVFGGTLNLTQSINLRHISQLCHHTIRYLLSWMS